MEWNCTWATVRDTEGENISLLFINKGSYPNTMHFHDIHDYKNDGVLPVIMSGEHIHII